MKICVLQSSYDNSNAPFKDFDPYCDPEYFYPKGQKTHTFESALIGKATASQQIRDLACKGYDVFINLCDGAFDEDRAGMEVTQLLEKYNLPFTGANSGFYEPSKELQKMMAYYFGVRTPAFAFAFNDQDIEEAAQNLNYPMIVKHFNGYSSVGMTRQSRVTNREELFDMAQKMIAEYEGALIEEFIDGREFTVLVAENPDDESNPIAFTPVECKFKNGETFKHFDLKWKEFQNLSWVACDDERLAHELKEMSKKIFVALGGVGYGRTDIRVNEKGEPYFLEINPNCGIFYPAPVEEPDALGSADFVLIHDKMGHERFVEHIIKCALKRAKSREKKTEVRFKPGRGYGLFAKRDIDAGELVNQHEEKAHWLTTKSYVDKSWKDPLKKKWFEQYAYPMTENVWSMWSDNPADWQQINHSCDPNAWLDGLNVVARKPISKGQQITMDYATFCCDNMETFQCKCSTPECRGTITGTDYLKAFVDKYSDHISDYVQTKRREHYQERKLNESLDSSVN